MQAYFSLLGVTPHRWEIQAITDLDNAFLKSRTEKKGGTVKDAKTLRRLTTKRQD